MNDAVTPNLQEIEDDIERAKTEDYLLMNQRLKVECTMGQGVVGDLGKYVLFSDQFSTCSAVVMFNDSTLEGGLFHYAAGGTGQQAQLQEMMDNIQPTAIYIEEREGRDFRELSKFFQGKEVTTIHSSRHYYVYVNKEDKLVVGQEEPIHGNWLNVTTMSSQPKDLDGTGLQLYYNAEHYGSDFAKY